LTDDINLLKRNQWYIVSVQKQFPNHFSETFDLSLKSNNSIQHDRKIGNKTPESKFLI